MIDTFMWGYWGWGGSTRKLVKVFDAVEADRGFKPPVFVDARIRRSVRAVGFRQDAFKELLGRNRYRWMKGLGNQRVLDRKRKPMELHEPGAVRALADLIEQSHRDKRRVIFFCACEQPRRDGERWCHRDLIAELLRKEARRRKVALRIQEWPGGAPRAVKTNFPEAAAYALRGGALTVPVPAGISPRAAVALPWGSYAWVATDDANVPLILGPAIHKQGRWYFPIRQDLPSESLTERELRRYVSSVRREWGYDPRLSMKATKKDETPWKTLRL